MRGEWAGREKDASVLEHSVGPLAARAADDLRLADHDIVRREVLEAQEPVAPGLTTAAEQRRRDAELRQGHPDDVVYPAHPIGPAPRNGDRQCQAIGEFVVVNDRAAAGRPADE